MPGQSRRRAAPIYVELPIRAELERVWELTQDPAQHQRWDARFSRIEYVDGAAEPVRFRYWLGWSRGPALTGTGVTTAQRERADGSRVSALRFASDSGWSPLQEGAGYWRYLVGGGGVTFITGYDYRTWRWPGGGWCDRWVVRPWVGWLTAWSFDRLRLWAERGVAPERALVHGLAEVAARVGAAAASGAVLGDGGLLGVPGSLVALLVLLLSLFVPPSPVTPAARRCRRRARRDSVGRAAARPPRLLNSLELP
ncbi:hypothetical protein ACIQBJ_26405 [Kitasatospora sp. NPDC088391]|uniref:hypothetical protein n=1 Tax=Kitasatospora sp. NPDC088391 TaxID=3364074 RepID=UPI0037FF6DBA